MIEKALQKLYDEMKALNSRIDEIESRIDNIKPEKVDLNQVKSELMKEVKLLPRLTKSDVVTLIAENKQDLSNLAKKSEITKAVEPFQVGLAKLNSIKQDLGKFTETDDVNGIIKKLVTKDFITELYKGK